MTKENIIDMIPKAVEEPTIGVNATEARVLLGMISLAFKAIDDNLALLDNAKHFRDKFSPLFTPPESKKPDEP